MSEDIQKLIEESVHQLCTECGKFVPEYCDFGEDLCVRSEHSKWVCARCYRKIQSQYSSCSECPEIICSNCQMRNSNKCTNCFFYHEYKNYGKATESC